MAKSFGTFGGPLSQAQMRAAVGRCLKGDLAGWEYLREQRAASTLSASERADAAGAFYAGAKERLGEGDFADSSRRLRAAAELMPNDGFLRERADLVARALSRRDPIASRMSLHEMQRRLRSICPKTACPCTSHVSVASCRGVLESGFPKEFALGGVTVLTMGAYRAYTGRGQWTTLLRRVKKEHEPEWLDLFADIVADYLVDSTDVLGRVDALVPVPAAPDKIITRGFAPNEILAQHLAVRLGLPNYPILIRAPGKATREASDAELAAQFRVDERRGALVRGRSVLLIEDIWTQGRTIPVCATKLKSAGAADVLAVALARAEH
jgi:predicted amidophosphoribosyltransferase